MMPVAIVPSRGCLQISGDLPMSEEARGRSCAGNERGSRQGDETLVGWLLHPAVVNWNGASAATLVSRDGSRGR